MRQSWRIFGKTAILACFPSPYFYNIVLTYTMGGKKLFDPVAAFFYFGLKAKNFGWNFLVANLSAALRATSTTTKLDVLYPLKGNTHSSIYMQFILNGIAPQTKFCQNTATDYDLLVKNIQY